MTARAPSTPAAPARAGLLRYRDVRLLLAGQAVSELGSQVGSIALPLVAVLGLGGLPRSRSGCSLVRGNAYLESSRSATQLGGPGLGGWLVQLSGAPWPCSPTRPASWSRPAPPEGCSPPWPRPGPPGTWTPPGSSGSR